jgi:AP-4 complex subunit epsilon-1
MAAGSNLSKDFFDLVKSIGESKSKQEEDRIVVAEVAKLKKVVGDPSIKGKLLKEYLIRLIYVEMLGHDASFGYMKAVEVSCLQRGRSSSLRCHSFAKQ